MHSKLPSAAHTRGVIEGLRQTGPRSRIAETLKEWVDYLQGRAYGKQLRKAIDAESK